MVRYKWHLSRIDYGWSMTRVTSGGIFIRDLYLVERVWYFFRMRKHDRMYPNWKIKCPLT